MVEFNLTETDEHELLNAFFIENGLEFSPDEPTRTDIVKCWKIVDEAGKLAGGVMLAKRDGEFIIDGIAVGEGYRKQKLGKLLLDKAIAEVKGHSGKSIFLVARAPDFFRANGFLSVPEESAPNFFECGSCPQYGVTCHPEVMKLSIEE